jgi:hypothetical protein
MRSEGLSFEAADLLCAGPAPQSEDHESRRFAGHASLLEAVRAEEPLQGTLPDPDRGVSNPFRASPHPAISEVHWKVLPVPSREGEKSPKRLRPVPPGRRRFSHR